jgi:PST family polysaccharide transporter
VFEFIKNSAGIRNFGWLALDKGVRILISLLIGSWVARYLGVTQFGLLAYVLTWVAILGSITSLGMDAIIVRRLIEHPEKSSTLLGTAVVFRLAAAVIGGVIMVGLVAWLRRDEPIVWGLVGIMVLGVLFQSMESYELWFQAQLKMYNLVVARLGLFLAVSVLKVFMIISGFGLVGFVFLSAVEIACGGLITFFVFKFNRVPVFVEKRWDEGVGVLSESWPLAISGVVVIVYMKISQLLLSGLLDDAALGVYTAALRIAEAPYFLPMIVASSVLPSLLRSKMVGAVDYKAARMRYFRLNALMGYGVAFPLVIGSPLLIDFLYGNQYSNSVEVLMVLSGAIVFVFIGIARTQYLINEGLVVLSLRFIIWGLLANVFMCLLLIPRFGAMGAAWAVFVGQSVATFFSSFIYPVTRSIGVEQMRALLTPWRISSQSKL